MRTMVLWIVLAFALCACGSSGGEGDSGTLVDGWVWDLGQETTGLDQIGRTDVKSDTATLDTQFDVPCVPSCGNRICGDDGCGGSCGNCGQWMICEQGQCQCAYATCQSICCPQGQECYQGGCCQPQCQGKECGDNACGGKCGVCPEVAPVCDHGTCGLECDPECVGKECGTDGCDGVCGTCLQGDLCLDWLGQCCTPQCEEKQCGPNGCSGECGVCPAGKVCMENGKCCTPSCDGAACGGDGCGGTCGQCPVGQTCFSGQCGSDPAWLGCSDGSREGFLAVMDYPLLAACGGAWNIPGIHNEAPACNREAGNTGLNPDGLGCNVTDLCAVGWHVCLGKADVMYRSPKGCDEILLGAPSPAFFLARTSSTGSFNCAPDTIGAPTSVDDLFGCGDLGCAPNIAECAPLTRASHDLCKCIRNKPTSDCQCFFYGELPASDPSYQPGNTTDVKCTPNSGGCGWCRPLDYYNKLYGINHPDAWNCGTDGSAEALNVVKSYPEQQGGVLCCKNQCLVDTDCGDGKVCTMQTCQAP